jgi:peptidoglycan lytic transglycosylase G
VIAFLKNRLIIIPAVIILICLSLLLGYWSSNHQIRSNPEPDRLFQVKKGQSVKSVIRELRKQKLTGPAWALGFYYGRHYQSQSIKAGTYRFPEHYRQTRILELLIAGAQENTRITFPEGWTSRQMAARLADTISLDPDRFLEAVNNEELCEKLGVVSSSLEGFLFPDTYNLLYDSTAEEIIMMMTRRFREVLNEHAPDAPDSEIIYQKIILASLIEREARLDSERKTVAGVIMNRLHKKYKLQCESTVRFLTGNWTGPLSAEDLAIDSPYNTYKYYGLPPGPICNPGRTSIEAAFAPEETPYLYFVANPDGSHTFSKSLREHNKAVKEYKKNNNK